MRPIASRVVDRREVDVAAWRSKNARAKLVTCRPVGNLHELELVGLIVAGVLDGEDECAMLAQYVLRQDKSETGVHVARHHVLLNHRAVNMRWMRARRMLGGLHDQGVMHAEREVRRGSVYTEDDIVPHRQPLKDFLTVPLHQAVGTTICGHLTKELLDLSGCRGWPENRKYQLRTWLPRRRGEAGPGWPCG